MTNVKLGFGLMRLPLVNPDDSKDIDFNKVNAMVDEFMSHGFNYFDTSYVYHDEKSQEAFRRCVSERYDREDYILADKLPLWLFEKKEDNLKYFNEMLERDGVEYFDYLLLHNVCKNHYPHALKADSFSFIEDLKKEGKALKIGFSTHDTFEFVSGILEKYPIIFDFIQIQANYVDWEDPLLQARKLYELALEYDLEIIIMEPLKGGTLVNIDESISTKLSKVNSNLTSVGWAFSFLASLSNVSYILSGMSNLEEVKSNCELFSNIRPLSSVEFDVLMSVASEINNNIPIPCTYCKYCLNECPLNINIPGYFALYNNNEQVENKNDLSFLYNNVSVGYSLASSCISCNKCMEHCTQNINIPEFLKRVSETYEK